MEKCNEKKVVNSFSIKQDGLDFVFTQHYFLNWDSSKSMFCNVCVLNVKGTSLKIFSFERFGWVVLGVHLVSMLSCNIFSYKGVMSVCCAQFPSAGRRVTGPRNLFVFGEICWCGRLFLCQPWHTGKLCSGSGLALFLCFDGLCEGV